MEPEINEFLESIPTKNTRKSYLRGLELFEEFSNRTVSKTIKMRRENLAGNDLKVRRQLEREVERFFVWLQEEKKLSQNTAYSACVAIKSLLSFYDMPLKLRRGVVNRAPTMPKDWIPSIDQLRLLYQIGDLREKNIISMAKDVPLRIGDYLSIKKKDVQPLLTSEKLEQPTFTIQTRKTKTPMTCFLSQETLNLLKLYVPTLRKNNPYLFQGRGMARANEDSINLALKNLVKKANLDTHGLNVRFHMFRKLFISVGATMGLNTDILKALTGKTIKSDMQPYYQGVNLYEQWKKVNNHLQLTQTTSSNGRIASLEELTEIAAEALADLVKPVIREKLIEKGRPTQRDTMGLIYMPNIDKMSPRELLELYVKLKSDEL